MYTYWAWRVSARVESHLSVLLPGEVVDLVTLGSPGDVVALGTEEVVTLGMEEMGIPTLFVGLALFLPVGYEMQSIRHSYWHVPNWV